MPDPLLTFPTHLFNPLHINVRPAGSVLSAGESLSGEVDTIRTDGGGYWTIQMAGIELMDPDLIRAWRAWEDMLDGGVTRVLVPIADVRQAPRPIIGGRLASPSQLANTTEDPCFPEAVSFSTPFIVARITADATLRATNVGIDVERGSRLKGGEFFSLTHATMGRRLYRVRRVLERDGQLATVQIRPPLREAIVADAPVDFDWPSVVATVLSDAYASPDLQYGRHATADIAFREAFYG